MGTGHAATHPGGLGRPAKISTTAPGCPSTSTRRATTPPWSGTAPKDEAYHFLPGADPGAHPETFLGVHPSLGRVPRGDALLPCLQARDGDLILRTSAAYLQVPGEGFHVPSGVLHGPGTALTLELQEDSDVMSMFQALNAGRIISKELLFTDVREQDRLREGERFPLRFVDWERNGDPDLHARSHLTRRPVAGAPPRWGSRSWVFYGSPKFSGHQVVVEPGATAEITEPGVHSVLAWSGTARWHGQRLRGGEPGTDELLVAHPTAVAGVAVANDGDRPFVAHLFSGPGPHPEAPALGPVEA